MCYNRGVRIKRNSGVSAPLPLTAHSIGGAAMATNQSTDSTIEIQLTQNYTTIIDAIDADLASLKWCVELQRVRPYAVRGTQHDTLSGRTVKPLHRYIGERIAGRPLTREEQVDHRDGNSLNNTRDNLRVCTQSQNLANKGMLCNNTSEFKGVWLHKQTGAWAACIRVNNKTIHLGLFDTKEDAAIVYNHAALEYFGDFAWFNDVANWQEITPIKRDRSSHLFANNTSGYTLINFDKEKGKWRAKVRLNSKTIHIGYFESVEDARNAQMQAEQQHKGT